MPKVSSVLLLALPAVIVGLVVAGLAALFAPWLVALMVGVVFGLALAWWLHQRAPNAVISAMNVEPLEGSGEYELRNLVDGLCVTHGLAMPKLWLHPSSSANAAVIGRQNSDHHLVVTQGLLDTLDRLELEAVIARELCQVRDSDDVALLWASLVTLPGGGFINRFTERVLDDRLTVETDLEGVALTRYPPGLARALAKLNNGGAIDVPAATTHLWLVAPDGTQSSPAHPAVVERIDTLLEL